MYRIDAERFILQITPFVHEEDFSCPINTNLMIRVSSYDFSADSTMDIGVCDLGEFALRLNRLYETLCGTARLSFFCSPVRRRNNLKPYEILFQNILENARFFPLESYKE